MATAATKADTDEPEIPKHFVQWRFVLSGWVCERSGFVTLRNGFAKHLFTSGVNEE